MRGETDEQQLVLMLRSARELLGGEPRMLTLQRGRHPP
jgi:hypothetical protein